MVSNSRYRVVETAAFGDDQRPVHQVGQQPEHRTALDRPTGTDRLRRLAGATSGEHRQPGQQPLLGLVEQVVGPVDGGPQRLLTLHRPAPAPGEQVEPVDPTPRPARPGSST